MLLDKNYSELGKEHNSQEIIKFSDPGKTETIPDRNLDGRFGWAFIVRDLYHSNQIELYYNQLSLVNQQNCHIIIHKGFLHFSLREDINPIRYSRLIDKSSLESLSTI